MYKISKVCLMLIISILASACVKNSSDQRIRNLSTELNMEQNDRIEADVLHRQVLERQSAQISRLEYELTKLHKVLKQICANKPELCKTETPAVLEDQ